MLFDLIFWTVSEAFYHLANLRTPFIVILTLRIFGLPSYLFDHKCRRGPNLFSRKCAFDDFIVISVEKHQLGGETVCFQELPQTGPP